jgi:branched-subunit amino acid aminotransferase/4-amino-4-deoxychorismate lyase
LLIILAKPLKKLPKSYYKKGVIVVSSPWRREKNPIYQHKTISYFSNIFARDSARKRGAFEVIFIDHLGRILEGSSTNIFVVKDSQIITPSLNHGILPGITRMLIFKLSRLEGIPLKEGELKINDIEDADELFITNSLIEIMPVRRFDRIHIDAVGPITQRLSKSYKIFLNKKIRYYKTSS